MRALIFDFDGLLVDTEASAFHAWRQVLAEHGADLPLPAWQAVIGGQSSVTAVLTHLEAAIGTVDREAVVARWREKHLTTASRLPLRDGVGEFLEAARAGGLRLAVASGATRDWVGEHLERIGVRGHFAVVSALDGHRPKPAPDVYLAALDALGVPAADAVAFEDSPTGVAAAVAAGLRCVAVPNEVTSGLGFPGAERVLPSWAAITLGDITHDRSKCHRD
ncbi:HAD family hydrolase [Amycolatopsis tolypomycina]|uniref:Haloacid dehalogenase superfamily, subfamily IA, variant 3 with third motif having DD or ED n=1 Tax=Amycolatopsis tolypomycina TaxID=208445 RepID=A0A1H4X3Q1_9PSEU|nr:HAD-IA family hydrolase [Amycolatopsis tolypomycina]SED00203.1 haloacid dehalogenase superfamily, subfamily IA, variant 3 with third motif having DD or ED [Amycolatopsis tolypomycina]